MKWEVLGLLFALPLHASQIFHMSLDEVFGLAETILVARVESVEQTSFEYIVMVDLGLSVTEVLLGPDSLAGAGLEAFYAADLPRVYLDPDGNEVTESPIVFGSGIEMGVSAGDTVVALAGRFMDDHRLSLVRLEGTELLGEIKELIRTRDQP